MLEETDSGAWAEVHREACNGQGRGRENDVGKGGFTAAEQGVALDRK